MVYINLLIRSISRIDDVVMVSEPLACSQVVLATLGLPPMSKRPITARRHPIGLHPSLSIERDR